MEFLPLSTLGRWPCRWRVFLQTGGQRSSKNCFEKKSAIYGWNWNKGCVRVCLPPCGCTEPAYDKNNMIRVAFPSLWHASFCFAYLSVMCNGWQNVVGTHPHAMQVHSMQPLALFKVWAAACAAVPVPTARSVTPAFDRTIGAMRSQDHRWLNCHVTRDREGLEFRSGGDGGWPGETR